MEYTKEIMLNWINEKIKICKEELTCLKECKKTIDEFMIDN